MSEAKHTPGPWRVEPYSANQVEVMGEREQHVAFCSHSEAGQANARLIAAAPDHALVARMLAGGSMRWESWGPDGRGELCFDGLRHATELDEFGVPELTRHLRARALLSSRTPSPAAPAPAS